jgi:hypothetical protein
MTVADWAPPRPDPGVGTHSSACCGTSTTTLNDSSHLGWPIPVLTPVPVLVLVLVLDGPIASRRRRKARSARGESKGSMPNTPVFSRTRTEPTDSDYD